MNIIDNTGRRSNAANDHGVKVINNVGTELLSSADNDMLKSVYDTNNNARVDVAESIVINIVNTEAIPIPIYSCVTSDGKIGDSDNVTHSHKVIGISIETIAVGASGKVIVYGLLSNVSWTWSNGDIFLNGTALSQTSPDITGFSKSVGKAQSENKMIVNLEESIIL